MKASLLVLASIFFAPVAKSQPEVSPLLAVEKIKVLSWNIYMLPGFLGHGKIPRAEAIGQLLASSDYDVIVFQEAFHQKSRKMISRLLESAYPFQAGPANQKLFSLKTNSGIWILSRLPIEDIHSIIFKTRHGMDAMSRKGALMVELKINNNPLQIVGTHLQNSGGFWRRQSQCAEIYQRLLKQYQRPGVPQILCGDFNVNRHGSEADYHSMLQTLDANDEERRNEKRYSYDRTTNDLQVEPGKQRDLIDYILIRANEAWVQSGERNVRVLQKRWHIGHKDLSDHYSLETEISFQNPALYTVSIPK